LLNIKRLGPQIQTEFCTDSWPSRSFTADARYVGAGRRSGLEEAEQFEDNHDNENHSDYVEDASVHARGLYQSEAVAASIFTGCTMVSFLFSGYVDSGIGGPEGRKS
jgi:hypothetical protein